MDNVFDHEIITRTSDETQDIACEFVKNIPENVSIALIGDLGAGKTTFVKGLARAIGINTVVNSPSFDIVHIHSGEKTLIHVDAYRLDGSQESANGLFLDDYLIPPYYLIVEWPHLLYGFCDNCDFTVSFKILSDNSHSIMIHDNRKIKE